MPGDWQDVVSEKISNKALVGRVEFHGAQSLLRLCLERVGSSPEKCFSSTFDMPPQDCLLGSCGEVTAMLCLRAIVQRGNLTLRLVRLFRETAKVGRYDAILKWLDDNVDEFRAIGAPGTGTSIR